MTHQHFATSSTIPPPSWDNVRSIYKKLSEEFDVLTESFSLTINAESKIYLDHLIIVIDEVDHCIDELPDKNSRDSITNSLVNYLGNDKTKWHHPNATESLAIKMENIKNIVNRESIQKEFIDAAKTIFHYTEIKRHTKDLNELLRFIRLEGEATAKLPLSMLKVNVNDPFSHFFTKLCMLMGIVDLIFDARQDYRRNHIALRPGLKLYAALCSISGKEGISLVSMFPKKLKFLLYCLNFAIALYRE